MAIAIPDDQFGFDSPSQPAPAPALVPPKMGILDVLAGAFGGGPDRTGAYNQGVEQGSQLKLRSAQTEGAIELARTRRAEAQAKEREERAMAALTDELIASGMDPASAKQTAAFGRAGLGNAQQLAAGVGAFADQGRQRTIADPNADRNLQLAAMEANTNRPVERFYDSGTGMQASQINPSAAPTVTPVGAATIRNLDEPNHAGGTDAPLIRSSPIGPVQSVDGGRTWAPVLANTDVAGFNAARTAGAATGTKQAGLAASLNTIDAFTADVDTLLAHPGFKEIYGMSSIADPRNYMRGTDAAGAQALRDKLTSNAFLVSIQKMRGMGALSNQEGAKVETALSAALRPGLGDDEAVLRLGELKTAIANLRKVAEQEANATENALAPGGPAVGTVEDGYRFMGGDPKNPTSWQPVQ